MCTNQKLVSEPNRFFSLRMCFRKYLCIEYAPEITLYAIWDIDVDISLWSGKFGTQTQVFPSLELRFRAKSFSSRMEIAL